MGRPRQGRPFSFWAAPEHPVSWVILLIGASRLNQFSPAGMSISSLSQIQSALRQHYDDVVLPLWRNSGFNTASGLPFEALDGATGRPLPVTRYRAMACARQLFVFSQAPDGMAHAARLFETLLRVFRNPAGGWYYSVDAAGQPLDTTQDLYTHAFIVLASAVYSDRSHHGQARKVLKATVDDIEARFRDAGGVYQAAIAADGQLLRGPEQNPVMHLTEAYLTAASVLEPAWFAERLRGLAQQVSDLYVDPGTHCIMELPLTQAQNRIEPGHQFEWYALLDSAPEVFAGLELASSVPRAAAWAEAHGVDADTKGVSAALDRQGRVIDPQQRIWAQTEYTRYLGLASREAPETLREAQLLALRGRFLHVGGWHEVLDAQGAVLRRDMPSTTPYHLWTGYIGP